MTEKFQKTLKFIKEKPMLKFGIGNFVLFCLCAFSVYFVRVVYSPVWLGQIKGTIVLFLICLAAIGSVYLGRRRAKGNTPLFMAILIIICGTFFAFINPPNQTPDEQSHFLRSYAMAMGDFDFDENQKFPNDVNLLIKHFPVAYNNGYPAKENSTVANCFKSYKEALAAGETAENTGIIIFQTVPYLPQTLGIFIARLFKIDALGAYYFARIANLLFYCLCCYASLGLAPRFKKILFALMMLPLTLFVAASCNNDSVFFGLMFLVFALVLAEKFTNYSASAFAIAMAVLCTGKISYIVFYLLLFCVTQDKWQVNIKKWQYVLVAVFAFLALYQGMALYVSLASNYGEIPRTMEHSNPVAQFKFILSNPFRYLVVFLDTLRNNSFFLFSGGLLGWLDVDLKLISYFSPIVLSAAAVKTSPVLKKEDFNSVIWFGITGILTYGAVLTGMYLSWTPVTLPQIIGLQMRYVFPAFFGLLLVLSYGLKGYIRSDIPAKKGEKSTIYISTLFALFGAALLFAAYYLPTKVIVYVS